MRRYSVPRIVFVNKLDRVGANPWRVIQQARDKLKLNAAALQVWSAPVRVSVLRGRGRGRGVDAPAHWLVGAGQQIRTCV
jgi:translation elongation factor EF-G